MSFSVENCTQLDDIAVVIDVDSCPTRSENVKVDLSKDFLAEALASMASAAPTRCDYRKARPTIYKVPKELKRGEGDERAYEPVAVRIGPFTKKKNSTAQLEKYKWCCVRQLMSWQEDHPDSDVTAALLSSCLESMKRLEPEIRASYSKAIELSSNELALNMLLDGCFILHRLLKADEDGIAKDYDQAQVFGRVWVWGLVEIDLVLLENQIPFLVLSKLFELLWSNGPKDALVKRSLRLFGSLCPNMLRSSAHSEIDYRSVRGHHLLHLFYLSIPRPTPQPSLGESDNTIKHFSCWRRPNLACATRREAPRDDDVLSQWIPCAKELEEAGVRFRKREKATSFLDIKFDSRSGVLEIPLLELDDSSDKLFRNLIAFEHTYPDTRCDITTYAAFMDCLITTREDMRILHQRDILVNQISGEQDASRFFSRICTEVWAPDDNYLTNLMKEVNDYRASMQHKWRAEFVRKYLSSPWVAMSVLAATLVLTLAGLQTYFTVYPRK